MPPSSGDLPGRRPPARKERRAAERPEKRRSRGKQRGSPGAAMRWRKADEVVDHFPQGDCECGADLAGAADLGVARSYQQEDVPEPQPSRRYQHDLHRARCACGKVHVAPRPAGVPDAPLSVGPRLSAMAVYLSVFQHVPVERAQALIADLTGVVVSAGFVHLRLGKAAGLVSDAVRLIRALIAAAPVAGFDETTLRSGPAGEKKYVHGAFTELYSAFWLGTRSLETMKEAGILPSFAGIVGIPSGRCFPLALGTYTRRTGRGFQDLTVRWTSRAVLILAGPSSATTRLIPAVRRPALRWVTCRTLTSVFDHDRSISSCKFLAFGQSPSRTAVKILCRSRAPFRSWAAQFTASHTGTSSGPFAVSGI